MIAKSAKSRMRENDLENVTLTFLCSFLFYFVDYCSNFGLKILPAGAATFCDGPRVDPANFSFLYFSRHFSTLHLPLIFSKNNNSIMISMVLSNPCPFVFPLFFATTLRFSGKPGKSKLLFFWCVKLCGEREGESERLSLIHI